MIWSASIRDSISTSGNRLYSSMTTSMYFPFLNGPHRSTATSYQGPAGSFDGLRGTLAVVSVTNWQAGQLLTISSTFLSSPGNHTVSRSNCLVLTIPWWPTCAKSIILSCRLIGTRILWPLSIIPVFSSNESSLATCFTPFKSLQLLRPKFSDV